MSDLKTSKDGAWALFDGMTWPVPGHRLADAEHALRVGGAVESDLLIAASVIAAYRQMVTDPKRKREVVVRHLREAMGK